MDTAQTPRFTYQKVHRYLNAWLDARAPELAHRLPSLRDVARHLNVSLSSSKQAFALLEAQGRIQARPKVGYFSVAGVASSRLPPALSLIDRLYACARQPGMLALSSDSPTMLASLEGPLLSVERELLRQLPRADAPPFAPFGEPALRDALARCYSRGVDDHWQADQVFVGADWRSVFELALRTLLPRGAWVLVESPCSWLVLRLLQAAGMQIVEAPLGTDGRFDLQALTRLFSEKPIGAAVLSSTVNIPQGGVMPTQDKQHLCALLAEHQTWLIENDSYGALCEAATGQRYRDHADPERLLVLAGFDKCIGAEAPFGYLLCRGATPSLAQAFLAQGFRLPSYRQQAVARLLSSGRLARHQGQLIRHLARSRQRMAQLLERHAADCLRLTMPVAGATFWLQAVRPVDMQAVCEQLLDQGVVIVPGALFSQAGYWRDHLRLSFTVDWQLDIEAALVKLARTIRQAPQLP